MDKDLEERMIEDSPHIKSKKRGRSRSVWIGLLVLGLVTAFVSLVNLGLFIGLAKAWQDSSSCLDPECVELGAQVLASLDETFDPCVDFYKFACNRALEQAIIPFGSPQENSFSQINDLKTERFRVQLSKPVDESTDLNATSKAATYYQSCMAGTDSRGPNSLRRLLSDLGGWPLVGIGEATPVPYNINDEEGYLIETLLGSEAFFSFSVDTFPLNVTKNILRVKQGGLTFPDVVYQNIDLYTDIIRSELLKVFNRINPNISDSVYIQAIDDIVAFESTIAAFTDFNPPAPTLTSFTTFLSTFGSLAELMPEFNWIENFKFYGRIGTFPIEVDSSTEVINLAPARFLTELNALITNTNATTLQNYAKWHAIINLLPLLGDEDFSYAYHSLTNLLTGKKYEGQPQYIRCVGEIESRMPFALARVLTEAYSPDGFADTISVIVKRLRTALKERISEKEWLDDATKQRALIKLDKIIAFLVYPDFIYNDDELNELYSGLEVSVSDSYFDNYIRLTKFTALNMIGHLSQRNNRNDWELDIAPTTVNAFYNPTGNHIYILEGILNTPFFKPYWPDYFKYSTIGHVIGHELVHGFDNNGRLFNENGNIEDWWSVSAVREFNTRAQCFVDQYNQYSLPGAGRVNGTLTLGENIADNGGLATAYQAYKDLEEKEKRLPGLKYTTDQLFFIGSTQVWCGVNTLDYQKQLLKIDLHSPESIRPLGYLSNSPEFAAAFNCPSESRMNPTHKCEIW